MGYYNTLIFLLSFLITWLLHDLIRNYVKKRKSAFDEVIREAEKRLDWAATIPQAPGFRDVNIDRIVRQRLSQPIQEGIPFWQWQDRLNKLNLLPEGAVMTLWDSWDGLEIGTAVKKVGNAIQGALTVEHESHLHIVPASALYHPNVDAVGSSRSTLPYEIL